MPDCAEIIVRVPEKNPGENLFIHAVEEVVSSLEPAIEKYPAYRRYKILERIVEPERNITFRVPWLDDNGEVQVNRGYRVEFNSSASKPPKNTVCLRIMSRVQTWRGS